MSTLDNTGLTRSVFGEVLRLDAVFVMLDKQLVDEAGPGPLVGPRRAQLRGQPHVVEGPQRGAARVDDGEEVAVQVAAAARLPVRLDLAEQLPDILVDVETGHARQLQSGQLDRVRLEDPELPQVV